MRRRTPSGRRGKDFAEALQASVVPACSDEEVEDVFDEAAAGLGEVAVEGGEAGLEVGKVRVGAAAIGVEPAQVGPLTTAALARIEAVVLARYGMALSDIQRVVSAISSLLVIF